jgi:hypothetical protein
MTQTITPAQFVAKWSQIQQKETAVSHSHFNDICHLVGHQTPLAYEKMLKKRTLINLYNGLVYYRQMVKAGHLFDPDKFDKVTRQSVSRADIQELDDIHVALDQAVLDVYGWPHDLGDEQILERLLALNLERAAG